LCLVHPGSSPSRSNREIRPSRKSKL
jgi:hypothetical protein